MIKGWNHFSTTPQIVCADKVFWNKFLYKNLDRIIRILANITKDTQCIVCGEYSMNFTSRSSLAIHVKNHPRNTINHWLKNFIFKSPEELENILYFAEIGNLKPKGFDLQ